MNDKNEIQNRYIGVFEGIRLTEGSVINQVITKNFNSSNKHTIAGELFFKASVNRPNHCMLAASRFNQHNREPNPPFPGWFLQIVGNSLSLAFGNGKTWTSVIAKKSIQNGKLYHVAFSIDNQKKLAELYLDGERFFKEGIKIKKAGSLVTIGALMPNGNYGFKGEINDFILGASLVKIEQKVSNIIDNNKLNLKVCEQNLVNIIENVVNVKQDIVSLENILSQIKSWKYRGLNIDTKLLENQIEFFQQELKDFIEDTKKVVEKLRVLDDRVQKGSDSEEILDDSIESILKEYKDTLHNLMSDTVLLDNAVSDLSKFKGLGVQLGNAFLTITEQKDNIRKNILEAQVDLEKRVAKTFKMKEIVTLNEL